MFLSLPESHGDGQLPLATSPGSLATKSLVPLLKAGEWDHKTISYAIRQGGATLRDVSDLQPRWDEPNVVKDSFLGLVYHRLVNPIGITLTILTNLMRKEQWAP